MIGYCELHEGHLSLDKFKWKGCWSCHYFRQDEEFPFIDLFEASDILSVSRSTIVRWIKNKKLVGYLFERGRKLSFLSPPHKKYFIESESIDNLKRNR